MSRAPGSVRIIGGRWRGTRLPVADQAGLRPTSDRTRETLFSMLTSRLGSFEELSVLDLFAGSGALGLEALSRYAEQVTLIEMDRGAADQLKKNLTTLGSSQGQVIQADAVS